MESNEITNPISLFQPMRLFIRNSSSHRLAVSAGFALLVLFSFVFTGNAGEPIRFSPMDGDTRTRVSIPWQLTLGNSHGQADALISLLRNRSGSGPETPLADYWGVDMSGSQGGSVNRGKLAEFLKSRGDNMSEKSLDDYFGNTEKTDSYWEGSEGDYGDSASESSNRKLSSSSRLEDFYLDSLQRDSQRGNGTGAGSRAGSQTSNGRNSWDLDDDLYSVDETSGSDTKSGGWGTGVQSFQAGGQQDTSGSQQSPSKQFMSGVRPKSGASGPEDKAAQGMSVFEPVGNSKDFFRSDSKSGEQKTLLANGMESSLGVMQSVDGSPSMNQEQRQQNAFLKVFNKASKWQVEDYWGGSVQSSSSSVVTKSGGSQSSLSPEDGSSLLSLGANSVSANGSSTTSGTLQGASNSGFLGGLPNSGGSSVSQSRVLGSAGQGQVSGLGSQGSGPSFDQLLKGSSSGSLPTPSTSSGNWFDSGNPLPKPSLRSVPSVLSIPQRPGVF